jgi:hypothetical protein
VIASRSAELNLLEKNRLVLSDKQCKVVKELSVSPSVGQLNAYKDRLITGSAAGVIGGAFGAKVTAKAISKVSMKAAAKVLVKAAAKKGVATIGGAAAGATIGSVVPGLGTAVGAAVGAAVGLAVGAGIDITMLAAEEKLTRADIKKELQSAVSETLRPYQTTFECK